MIKAKNELRRLYAKAVTTDTIKATLDLLKERGLPKELYTKYMDEAMDKGLIPVPGRSIVGGKVLSKEDILTAQDILEDIPVEFWKNDKGFYGIG